MLAPWTARNWITFDRPVLVATEGGETLAGANCADVYWGGKLGGWEIDCVGVERVRGNEEAARFNEAGLRGLRYARDHLDRLPVVVIARLGRTWGYFYGWGVPEGRSAAVMRAGSIMFLLLLVPAAYGLVVLRRRRFPFWILITPFITVTVTAALLYGNLRFRHSAELPLVVLAAVALTRIRLPAR